MKHKLESLVNQMVERGINYEDAITEFEKRFFGTVLARHKGNCSKAAQALGIHRNTLSRKIEELGLDHPPKRRKKSRR